MLESAEIGHRVSRADYEHREAALRQALLAAQSEVLRRSEFPVIVLVHGLGGAGKGDTVNLLNEWMDPRHIRTEAFGPPGDADRGRPAMWRFWQVLPPKGRIAILFGSWYSGPIAARVRGDDKEAVFERHLEGIRRFERMLAAEGAVLVKLWFHLSRSAMRKRLRQLQKDPHAAWRLTPQDWADLEHYARLARTCEQALRGTDLPEAAWHVVEGWDAHYRALTAGQHLLEAMRSALARQRPPTLPLAAVPKPPRDGRSLLAALDYGRTLPEKRYRRRLQELQARLNERLRDPRMRERSLVLVFEGMDAAGKGGTIRRVTRALDARYYRVIPVAAPNEEERAQPYLWRFWRHVPAPGHTTIYDRSWYGRVLVERVEGLCSEADWLRAYDEINDFEAQLARAGAVVLKFWLAITPEEQLRRFEERRSTPHKRHKITAEDWRNRDKWPLYEQAVADMVERTSTATVPWHLVASDDKRQARIDVLATICKQLEKALRRGVKETS
ncbi:MAG TPA: polyphosphate:AMP phosphotransferase [Ramlibacter sp.]|nr:polyphosphate:AMP phosphotransferase [Ramlibacter sp.]